MPRKNNNNETADNHFSPYNSSSEPTKHIEHDSDHLVFLSR